LERVGGFRDRIGQVRRSDDPTTKVRRVDFGDCGPPQPTEKQTRRQALACRWRFARRYGCSLVRHLLRKKDEWNVLVELIQSGQITKV